MTRNVDPKKPLKRARLNEISVIKDIVIRNDNDPHVYCNVTCNYIKLGEYVYKVKPFDSTWMSDNKDDIICLTLTQRNDVTNYIFDNKIMVNSYYKHVEVIDKLTVNLSSNPNFEIVVNKEKIADHIRELLLEHTVHYDQRFTTIYEGLQITVSTVDLDTMTLGKVVDETEIDFDQIDDNIIVYNKCVMIDSNMLQVYVTKCQDLNLPSMDVDQNHISKFPLIINRKHLDEYVREICQDSFTNDSIVSCIKDNFKFTFNLKINGYDKKSKYKNLYQIQNDGNILSIESNTSDVIITDGTKVASKIRILVRPKYQQKYKHKDYFLFVDELVKLVENNIKFVTRDQSFKHYYNNKETNLTIEHIKPFSENKKMYQIVPGKTTILFRTEMGSRFVLVKNKIPHSIDHITYKLRKPIAIRDTDTDDDQKIQFMDLQKLERTVRKKISKTTAVGQRYHIEYQKVEYELVAKKIIFNENVTKNQKNYYTYGIITKETEIEFQLPKKEKLLLVGQHTNTKILEHPIMELEKHVGGISDELREVVNTICLSRGKLKEEFIARGLKAAKGIILHGPPGTGKTTLARNLGKILGCEGDRFRLMSGPEIFNKWVGESEANVRAIFKPAKEAWKKYGDNAPVYMVVIDEIDAMIPARSGSSGNPVRDTVVNQFLAEMDGLEQFNNLICIGITNRLELIDPAAVRAGRFGVHVKIDLPDQNGRMKIFDIHTRNLKDLDRLCDVDFDKLANLTDKFSGAEIESSVELASRISLERLNACEVIDEETIQKLGKVTHDDFVTAIKKVSINHKNTGSDKIPNMYI